MTNNITHQSAVQLTRAVRKNEYSSSEVLEAFLDQIEKRNKTNAFITVAKDRARKQAKKRDTALQDGRTVGPLHGLPVAIKDLTPVKGLPHTYGSKAFADNTADHSAEVVKRLENAGAVVIGKTNTPEFGHKGTTDNRLIGPTKNPFDTSKNAGGSSGGSAAAVADALVPVAQGTDGGGSIRIPSSFCGLYGLKPSFGRIPIVSRPDGFGNHTPMLHHGPITRTVDDAALLLDVMSGTHPRDPFSQPDPTKSFRTSTDSPVGDFRVAYSPNLDVFPISEDVSRVVASSIETFRDITAGVDEIMIDHGYSLTELTNSWKRGRELNQAMNALHLRDNGVNIDQDRIPDELATQIAAGKDLTAVDLKKVETIRTGFYDTLQTVFESYDLLLTPTLGVSSINNGRAGPEEIDETQIDPGTGWRLTFPFNLTGHPVASIPIGESYDLPVGLQVVGQRFADDDVLAISAAFERQQPWQHMYPFRE